MSYRLIGAGGASGLALGPAFLRTAEAPVDDLIIEGQEAALVRLVEAQAMVANNMRVLAERERAVGRDDPALLFDFLSFLAEDTTLTDEITRHLHSGVPLSSAIDSATATFAAQIAALDSSYHRDRATDIAALGREIRAALHGRKLALPTPPPGSILVVAELSPSELAELPDDLAGLVTADGSPTSHTTILARARGIPTIVGVGRAALDIPVDAELALNGDEQVLLVNPEPHERATFLAQRMARPQVSAINGPTQLANGTPITLWANSSSPDEIARAISHGADGIGLFRTEFLFLERHTLPSEEEQYIVYRAALAALAGRPLVVRTLDIGGDKPLPYLGLPHEANPALGLRGIRILLHHPQLLVAQLRALLRAAVHGDLRIMLPMVANPEDLALGRRHIAEVAIALQQEGIAHRANILFGAMIETPAAAVTIDLLAPLADFFSIGTNDLSQYALAADRTVGQLSQRYPAHTPSVLRLVDIAVKAARSANRPISVCGELAGIPESAAVLVGLGIATLSMAPSCIPGVSTYLARHTADELHAMAEQALAYSGN
ncbi:MAG: phosphoenolpyruvate--protein phosphotransferase [Roseiflexaceae bacterium]|nr:phosphoenolpyruvate--protein phosphotransferase [Roseiflexaceae bacterium]